MILRYNILPILWALFILLLTMLPGDSLPKTDFWPLPWIDKWAHAFLFAMLVFLSTTGFKRQYSYGWLRYHAKGSAFLIAVVYGFLLEIMQLLVADERTFEWGDIVANTIGSAFGVLVFMLIYGKELNR